MSLSMNGLFYLHKNVYFLLNGSVFNERHKNELYCLDMKKVHCLFWKEIWNPTREGSLNKYGCHYDCQIFLCALDHQRLLSLAETVFSILLFHLSSVCVCLAWFGMESRVAFLWDAVFLGNPYLSPLFKPLSSMSDSVSSLKLWELILLLYFQRQRIFKCLGKTLHFLSFSSLLSPCFCQNHWPP